MSDKDPLITAFEALKAEDFKTAAKWFQLAADQGEPLAQFTLGEFYFYGLGVESDFAQALEHYRQSALKGNVHAQNSLGEFYSNGRRVRLDHREALKWYRLAANQDYPESKFNLGVAYKHGHGVKEDCHRANGYFADAVDGDVVEAIHNLAISHFYGQGVEEDVEIAHRYFTSAADKGFSYSKFYLGVIYLEGKGVEKDINRAAQYFRDAAEEGLPHVKHDMGVMYTEKHSDDTIANDRVLSRRFSTIEKRLSLIVPERNQSKTLLKREESLRHEFKASFSTPYPDYPERKTNEKTGKEYFLLGKKEFSKKALHQYLETICLKAIVSFLNTKGGTLVIGVHEQDNNKTVVGIEHDNYKSWDAYQLRLSQSIINRIGTNILSDCIELKPSTYEEGKTLCVLEITPYEGEKPASLDNKFVYRRTGPRVDLLEGDELSDFIIARVTSKRT